MSPDGVDRPTTTQPQIWGHWHRSRITEGTNIAIRLSSDGVCVKRSICWPQGDLDHPRDRTAVATRLTDDFQRWGMMPDYPVETVSHLFAPSYRDGNYHRLPWPRMGRAFDCSSPTIRLDCREPRYSSPDG